MSIKIFIFKKKLYYKIKKLIIINFIMVLIKILIKKRKKCFR
jgi:hypothetical protein